MATYRYHFYDTKTGTRTDILPLENVAFTTELRGVGTFQGDVPLYSEGLSASRVTQAVIPYRTKVYVERNNALVWGGMVVPPRTYDSTKGRLAVNAVESLGLTALRFLPSLTYTATDQLAIARSLVSTLQSVDGGNLGITLDASVVSGVLRDRTYSAADFTAALTALTELSEVENGFEFATQTVWGPAGPTETLLLGYPLLGRRRTGSGMVLEYNGPAGQPGNVISYTWADDVGLYTRSYAQCQAADTGVALQAVADNPALRTLGYPLLEQSLSFDGITSQATLQAHANAVKTYSGGHHVTAAFIVAATPGLEIGDWTLGDDAMVRVSDWRFPPDQTTGAPGFADYLRIVGVSVAPDSQSGIEQYTFTMGDFVEAL